MPLNTNAYSWYAENNKQFPTLSQLARRLLVLPATSVPNERAFSKADHIVLYAADLLDFHQVM